MVNAVKEKTGAQKDEVSYLQSLSLSTIASNPWFLIVHFKFRALSNNFVFAFSCLGGEPYAGIKTRDLVYSLGKGFRMRRPKHVDKEL